MPSCEVQRTLVKSPPELWSELSDPASLAKHLGEFGEIRIAHIEPETAVEWEAENVRGVVELNASGWGTKVTLTAVRERAAEQASAAELSHDAPTLTEELESFPSSSETELAAAGEPVPAEPEAASEPTTPTVMEPAIAPEPAIAAEPEFELEPEPIAIAEAEPEPERRRGLFARIFRRRRRAESTPEPEILATEDLGCLDQALPAEEPFLLEEPAPADRPDLAAELAQVEQAMVEQDTALLTAVLDRLGAAHHRPFSRG